ncbi:MAG: AAA family ATPase [Bacilli bacterium]|nr:AAA family ATPase [Bacilli bacterium]
MANLRIGYLFKKKYVAYENKKYEIFEFVDYVAGIGFTNTENNDRCNVLSGNYNGTYASFINENMNEEEYVFLADSLDHALKVNDNHVDFVSIRKKRLSSTGKYYLRGDSGTDLTRLVNQDLINYLQKGDKKEQSDFDEDEFKKTSDISSMYSSIKKTIISQDEQIMQILTALFKNQKVVNSDLDMDLIAKLKENILIYGSTGTGKTEILKRISKLYNIPIVIEDATALSETGYQGRKITDMLEDLCHAADNNIELAEKGILVIDEFDKLAEKSGDSQSHVSRLGVQRSLLKLLDGTLFYFEDKKFDTSKLTVVGLGAFTGITEGDDYKQLTADDFMKYGIMRELIGRFSKTIAMNPLSKEDIIKILKESDFSPLNTYKKLFDMLEVNFDFSDEFIEYIAELAIAKQSGARSLKTVFDDCISSALFRIFAGEYSSISLVKPDDENNKPYVLTKTKERKHGFFGRK